MSDPTIEDRLTEVEALVSDMLAAMHAGNHQAVARVRALAAARKEKQSKAQS